MNSGNEDWRGKSANIQAHVIVRAICLTSRLVFQVERRPIVEPASHIAHGQPVA